MSVFGKDYTEQFKDVAKEIVELKAEIRHNPAFRNADKERNHIINLIQDNSAKLDELTVTINQLKEEIEDIKNLSVDTQETIPKSRNRGGSITNMVNFEKYSLQREYDMDKSNFYLIAKDGRKYIMDLNFRQIVSIIKGFKNGLSVTELQKRPLLCEISKAQIQRYIYIWRAGGLNKAIMDNARKLGFNPKKLISYEVGDLDGY